MPDDTSRPRSSSAFEPAASLPTSLPQAGAGAAGETRTCGDATDGIEEDLASLLTATWARQGRDGFLLSDPNSGAGSDIETRTGHDHETGVDFRFRWIPHREVRGDVEELKRRGIMSPVRNRHDLFADPRDPQGRHCFLCERNIRIVHPMEELIPISAAGRSYLAGANFAWIEPDHFTVMDREHVDQAYTRQALEAAAELHWKTDGRLRVLFNGPGAGASIPWHFHFQVTTAAMPIESLPDERVDAYPTLVRRFPISRAAALMSGRSRRFSFDTGNDAGIDAAHRYADRWMMLDSEHHTVNLLVATPKGAKDASVWIFPRDRRRATVAGKGLMGGFEVAGDFVLSAPGERDAFEQADAASARQWLSAVRPESAPEMNDLI